MSSYGLPNNLGSSAGNGLNTATRAGTSLTQAGSFLTGAGQDAFSAGTNYYKQLLGNRQTAQAAVAPAIANINDSAAGARAGIQAGYQEGTARDINLGNVTRDQQRAITGLYSGVQPAAAAALTSAGSTATGQGIGAFTGAGNVGNQTAQVGGGLQLGVNQLNQQLGTGIGGLATTLGGMIQKGLKGGSAAGAV